MRSRFARVGHDVVLCAGVLALIQAGCASAQPTEPPRYRVDYHVALDADGMASVTLTVDQSGQQLRQLEFVMAQGRFTNFASALPIERDGDRVRWQPDSSGGSISWQVNLNQQRQDGSVDAMVTQRWAVFRAEDAIPGIASRSARGASADTTLRFELPTGWSIVTGYLGQDGEFDVDDANRRFDRPDGWIVAGALGVRHDLIANTRVAVAAPREQQARRLDVMAFMNWHLPYVRDVFPAFPDRILIAMADDPFFRGGLSAPNSLFLHTDRPLISGNGTSTLLHELIHIGLGRRAVKGEDWIIEGLAEFYSVALMRRAGTITPRREQSAFQSLQEWGESVRDLKATQSKGARTARAVGVLADVDAQIRAATNDRRSLDDVVRRLAASEEPLSLRELRIAVEATAGQTSRALDDSRLPGY